LFLFHGYCEGGVACFKEHDLFWAIGVAVSLVGLGSVAYSDLRSEDNQGKGEVCFREEEMGNLRTKKGGEEVETATFPHKAPSGNNIHIVI